MLLLDVNMPGMDGLELARELGEQGNAAPIIIISADAQEHQRQPRQQASYGACMVKPINNRQLVERAGPLLALQWLYAGSPPPELPPPRPALRSDSLPDQPISSYN